MQHNVALVECVQQWAERKRATPAQIALAWLLAQKAWIVPIPGSKRIERIRENAAAADLTFTPEELREMRARLEAIPIVGARYPEEQEKLTGL